MEPWDELGSGEEEGSSADCDDEDGCQASGDGQSQNCESHTNCSICSFTTYSSSLCLGQLYCIDIYFCPLTEGRCLWPQSQFFCIFDSPQDFHIFRLLHIDFPRGLFKSSSTEGSPDQEMACADCAHPRTCIVLNPFAQSLSATETKCWTNCCRQIPKSLFWPSSMVVRGLSS